MMAINIGILLTIGLVSMVFMAKANPQFGGHESKKDKNKYEQSPNFKDGKFHNQNEIDMSMGLKDILSAAAKYIKPDPNTSPDKNIDVLPIDSLDLVNYESETPRLLWFGHSSFLIQISGKNILIDPMLSEVAAPYAWLGQSRFNKQSPIDAESLPHIDAVILSHDHYDHLDYKTIMTLKDKVDQFYMPLGVSKHLKKWGIKPEKINELDWDDSITLDELSFICTPAQHFSGRSITDNSSTLWCSWIIKNDKHNIYFSGDGGYGPHFKKIGEQYGPFDFAMMECGQYNEKWKDIHMFPEQTVQASIDIRTKAVMPIHWGAFKLAEHSWTNPIDRFIEGSKDLDYKISTPEIGEFVNIQDSIDYPNSKWWIRY